MTKGSSQGYRKTENVRIIERRNFEGSTSALPATHQPRTGGLASELNDDEAESEGDSAPLLLDPAVLHDDAHR
jgi:hypothetical protein